MLGYALPTRCAATIAWATWEARRDVNAFRSGDKHQRQGDATADAQYLRGSCRQIHTVGNGRIRKPKLPRQIRVSLCWSGNYGSLYRERLDRLTKSMRRLVYPRD